MKTCLPARMARRITSVCCDVAVVTVTASMSGRASSSSSESDELDAEDRGTLLGDLGIRVPAGDEGRLRDDGSPRSRSRCMHMPESDDTDADRLHGTSSC